MGGSDGLPIAAGVVMTEDEFETFRLALVDIAKTLPGRIGTTQEPLRRPPIKYRHRGLRFIGR